MECLLEVKKEKGREEKSLSLLLIRFPFFLSFLSVFYSLFGKRHGSEGNGDGSIKRCRVGRVGGVDDGARKRKKGRRRKPILLFSSLSDFYFLFFFFLSSFCHYYSSLSFFLFWVKGGRKGGMECCKGVVVLQLGMQGMKGRI